MGQHTSKNTANVDTAPAPRIADLQRHINSRKADIAALVRGVVAHGGKAVEICLTPPALLQGVEGPTSWTAQELQIARAAFVQRYEALHLTFVVSNETLDPEALMAEMMCSDPDPTPPAQSLVGTADMHQALQKTDPLQPVLPPPEEDDDSTAKKAGALLDEMLHRRKKKPS